jgi:hypothetical protein
MCKYLIVRSLSYLRRQQITFGSNAPACRGSSWAELGHISVRVVVHYSPSRVVSLHGVLDFGMVTALDEKICCLWELERSAVLKKGDCEKDD